MLWGISWSGEMDFGDYLADLLVWKSMLASCAVALWFSFHEDMQGLPVPSFQLPLGLAFTRSCGNTTGYVSSESLASGYRTDQFPSFPKINAIPLEMVSGNAQKEYED